MLQRFHSWKTCTYVEDNSDNDDSSDNHDGDDDYKMPVKMILN